MSAGNGTGSPAGSSPPPASMTLVEKLELIAPRGLSLWLPVVTSAVVAFTAQVVLGGDDVRHYRWWLAAGLVGTAAVVVLPAWATWASERSRKRATDYAVEIQSRYSMALSRAIAPIAQQLAGLTRCNGANKARLQGELQSAIMHAALTLTSVDDVRVVLYMYNRAPANLSRELVRKAHYGREDQPRLAFVKGADPRANAVHRLVESCEIALAEDVHQLDDAVLYAGKTYGTFIAASVYADQQPLGLLTIDAPIPRSLDNTHKGMMKALASLLAAASTP